MYRLDFLLDMTMSSTSNSIEMENKKDEIRAETAAAEGYTLTTTLS